MTSSEPTILALPHGGTAVQWRQLGDHPRVGRPWVSNLKQRCPECGKLSADHGILFGREPTKVCPGDYIVSSPTGKHPTRLDAPTFEAIYCTVRAERIEDEAVADGPAEGRGFEPLAAANERVLRRLAEQQRAAVEGGVSPDFVRSLPIPRTIDEAIRQRDGWIEMCAFHEQGERFYRGIVVQIGEMFGDEAKTSDDGTLQADVLALKVPELVRMELSLSEANHGEIDHLNKEMARQPYRRQCEELKAENLRLRTYLDARSKDLDELRAMGDRIEAALTALEQKQQARVN